jgi:hypothetical protein
MTADQQTIRCPTCGHPVASIFEHIDIDCEHDMTPEQIADLLRCAPSAPMWHVEDRTTEQDRREKRANLRLTIFPGTQGNG